MRARTLKQPRTEVHWSRKFAGKNSPRLILKKTLQSSEPSWQTGKLETAERPFEGRTSRTDCLCLGRERGSCSRNDNPETKETSTLSANGHSRIQGGMLSALSFFYQRCLPTRRFVRGQLPFTRAVHLFSDIHRKLHKVQPRISSVALSFLWAVCPS